MNLEIWSRTKTVGVMQKYICDILVSRISQSQAFAGNVVSVSKVFEGPASPIIEGPARYPFPLPADARAKREAETASGQRASW